MKKRAHLVATPLPRLSRREVLENEGFQTKVAETLAELMDADASDMSILVMRAILEAEEDGFSTYKRSRKQELARRRKLPRIYQPLDGGIHRTQELVTSRRILSLRKRLSELLKERSRNWKRRRKHRTSRK